VLLQTPQAFYPQIQFVQVDAHGQCVPMATPPTQQVLSYSPVMQPMEQGYGQTVYPVPVSDSSNGYCMPAYQSFVYTGQQAQGHYPSCTTSIINPISAAHYGSYNPPQSSSPQLCQAFPPIRSATPPSLPLGQPMGYPAQQGQMVPSPPQYHQQYFSSAPPHPFPGPQPQVMQVQMRPQGGAGGGVSTHLSHHHHPQHHQQLQHMGGGSIGGPPPQLQHSQSYPVLRTIPTSLPSPSPISLGPGPGSLAMPGQQPSQPYPVKSMSMGSMRLNGASTPDKEIAPGVVGGCGTQSMMGGFGQAGGSMQLPGQFMTQGLPRQPQPGQSLLSLVLVLGKPSQ
jgi:hypothetical protein